MSRQQAIAASALATPLPLQTTTAAGALVSIAVLLLSATGALRLLTRHLPVPIIKGIQLGAGLRLVTSGANLILPLSWLTPALNSRLSTAIFFLALFLTQRVPRFPYALLLFLLGLLTTSLPRISTSTTPYPAATPNPNTNTNLLPLPITLPDFLAPPAWSAALAQLPLTTLNSIIAVAALASALFPPTTTTMPGSFPGGSGSGTFSPPSGTTLSASSSSSPAAPPGVTALGLSVAAMNLAGCWFGAMPVCHGAGGLAAQSRFGARSGASVVLLGAVKVGLGLVAVLGGQAGVVGWLGAFPRGVLGVMVVAAGLELGKVGGGVDDGDGGLGSVVGAVVRMREGARGGREGREERWMVMMVTAAGTLAFRNDAVGFLAGCCCHGAYVLADWVERRDWGTLGEWTPLLD